MEDKTKEPKIAAEPTIPETFFDNRLPKKAFTKNPSSGNKIIKYRAKVLIKTATKLKRMSFKIN